MSRSRDTGDSHGHFRQKCIMFIFYMDYFVTQLYVIHAFFIALTTVLIIPQDHLRPISKVYGHLQGHMMCHLGVLSALTPVHVMGIYSFAWIQS